MYCIKTYLLNKVIERAKESSNYNSFVELMQMYPLTDDDIAAAQQAVLWYFTNYGESTQGLYDKTSDTSSGWLNYTEDGENYKSLSDYNLETNEGRQRQIQAEMLYKYLIKTAKEDWNLQNVQITLDGTEEIYNKTK